MKSEVETVLLIPAHVDFFKLLDSGPCGMKHPVAGEVWSTQPDRENGKRHWISRSDVRWRRYKSNGLMGRRALVLLWEGEVVQPGVDRAISALQRYGDLGKAPKLRARMWPRKFIHGPVGKALADLLDCTLVVVDGAGREF